MTDINLGGMEIYCPWDVVNHVSALVRGTKEALANYWKDTSHNEIIRRFIDLPGLNVNEKFEILLGGGVIQEQGTGRPDVIVKDRKNRRAVIIEIKRSKKEDAMEKDCKKALAQIHREQYARDLLKGYQQVLCYGAAFFEKSCLIIR